MPSDEGPDSRIRGTFAPVARDGVPLPAQARPADDCGVGAEIRETHSAVIGLIGDVAYKVKKPVDLGFLDFRSLTARRHALEKEVRLNRRLAPDVYLDLARLVGSDGEILEHVLVMRRMPEHCRLSTLVRSDQLSADNLRRQLRSIARRLADFHSRAARGEQISDEAGQRGLRRRWTDNLTELEPFVGTSIDDAVYRHIRRLALDYVDGRGHLFERRRLAGLYLDGHGDVTAEDIFCLGDGPRILDCIDFDDRLRWVDALDDAAFLAMDLEHLHRAELGQYFLDQYAEFSAVSRVPSLEHHYIAYRALVRGKIACLRADEGEVAVQEDVDAYLQLTLRHLETGQVRLILVGGAPGTGKTTVATRVADSVGAVLLSSDVVRTELSPTHADFDDESRSRVYRELLGRAREALMSGETVVVDATWQTEQWRTWARQCAEETCSNLVELECHAPPALAAARAQRRLEHHESPSLAGRGVALTIAERRTAWPTAIAVDCSGSPDEALRGIADVFALTAR